MNRKKLRHFALALSVLLLMAVIMAYFTGSDHVTNAFRAVRLDITLIEPSFVDNKTVVPEQMVAKDPQIRNDDETSAYVFMKVTVPCTTVTVEKSDGTDSSGNTEKGTYADKKVVPLFKFVKTENNVDSYDTDPFSTVQSVNLGWYLLEDYPKENAGSDGSVESITYLYAWTGSNADDRMAVLYSGETTSSALFDKVIFVNAREDDKLPGSRLKIGIEVFGIQNEFLKSSSETETKAEEVWKLLKEEEE